jgi:hypothetical protein
MESTLRTGFDNAGSGAAAAAGGGGGGAGGAVFEMSRAHAAKKK